MITAVTAHLVNFTLLDRFWATVNLPTVLATAVMGVLAGVIIERTQRRMGAGLPAASVSLLATMVLLGLQLSSVVGQSYYQPVNTQGYIGAHIGYVILSIIYGGLVGPGMMLSHLGRDEPLRDMAAVLARRPGKTGAIQDD